MLSFTHQVAALRCLAVEFVQSKKALPVHKTLISMRNYNVLRTNKTMDSYRKEHSSSYSSAANPDSSDLNENNEVSATEALANLSKDDQRKLKVLQLEYDVFESTAIKVPPNMTDERWLKVLQEHESFYSRKKIYNYWFKKDMTQKNRAEKTVIRQAAHLAKYEEIKRSQDEGLWELKNTFLQFVSQTTMNRHYFSNLAYAMQFGRTIVYDLGYSDQMKGRAGPSLIKQLTESHAFNKVQMEPSHFVFCNLTPGSQQETNLVTAFGGPKHIINIPITVTSQHYLDLYPRQDLVYLSPNAPNMLREDNPDNVYIIGGLVDIAGHKPLTFAKAKREGIRCVKLPLDAYLDWGLGNKALNLDHVTKIMIDWMKHGSWEKAFSHVPRKRLKDHDRYIHSI